jgi:hypothetical protein
MLVAILLSLLLSDLPENYGFLRIIKLLTGRFLALCSDEC